jgi:hypothetical protein
MKTIVVGLFAAIILAAGSGCATVSHKTWDRAADGTYTEKGKESHYNVVSWWSGSNSGESRDYPQYQQPPVQRVYVPAPQAYPPQAVPAVPPQVLPPAVSYYQQPQQMVVQPAAYQPQQWYPDPAYAPQAVQPSIPLSRVLHLYRFPDGQLYTRAVINGRFVYYPYTGALPQVQ